MSFNCSTRNCSSRPVGGRYTTPVGPVTTASARDADCLSGLYLPSSFQTGSWLLDHCQESCCEPSACQPQPTCYQRTSCISTPVQVTCNRQTTCVSNPCSTPCSRPLTFVSTGCQSLGGISSSCQPVGGISTVCQPVGGISTVCQPTCGVSRTYQQSCVSSCRRTC
ncbi:keratin-associated protein 11-1 isoform X2 [Apodemus sylvaticus]|uniref:keratin-associated protein 11-1 isoform X2 n=1 Tax=Apodemus sylvaticus TaxID=10129 RepID=UPI0022449B48|nr:keratin-associated protein 11-1 isoform X2 [Apodemus sylvaticus]